MDAMRRGESMILEGQIMSHLHTCTTRRELTGNIWTYYSDPDPQCNDRSHHDAYTEETK